MTTATIAPGPPVSSPADGPGAIPVRCHQVPSTRHQRYQPVVAVSWRVLLPGGRLLGWIVLVRVRGTGRSVWGVAAPYGGWVPIPGGARRGRDAAAALLRHHGIQEVHE